MANATITTVQLVYKRVIDETIKNSRETFLNEGIEESILQELRTLWESKVSATRAVEPAMNPPDYIPRGQIYKYNYRNQPPTTQQATTGTSFSAHIPAFIPQVVQHQSSQQQQQQQQQQALARQQLQHQQNVARQQQNQQQQNQQQQNQQQQNQQQQNQQQQNQQQQNQQQQNQQQQQLPQHTVAASQPPRVQPLPSQNIGNVPSNYPSVLPFPSLSGVTTVTKNEFNNASDSIQVDGAWDGSRDQTSACSRDTLHKGVSVELSCGEEQLVPAECFHKVTAPCETALPSSSQINVRKCGKESSSKPSKKDSKFSQKDRRPSRRQEIILQLDGAGDSDEDVGEFVDSEESEEDENEDTDEEIDVGGEGTFDIADDKPSSPVEDDDPLNSEDDDSDDGNIEFEATDNVVVCLFDKITRSKNKWKLYLKEGVMNIGGKDHVFHKAIGDGEW